jgi:hypothetical protein
MRGRLARVIEPVLMGLAVLLAVCLMSACVYWFVAAAPDAPGRARDDCAGCDHGGHEPSYGSPSGGGSSPSY